jgi:hypothetical protein
MTIISKIALRGATGAYMNENLRNYMLNYPNGSFVGFMKDVAEIMQELGMEWDEFGKKEYAKAFVLSSRLLNEVSENLELVKQIFDKEQLVVKSEVKNDKTL